VPNVRRPLHFFPLVTFPLFWQPRRTSYHATNSTFPRIHFGPGPRAWFHTYPIHCPNGHEVHTGVASFLKYRVIKRSVYKITWMTSPFSFPSHLYPHSLISPVSTYDDCNRLGEVVFLWKRLELTYCDIRRSYDLKVCGGSFYRVSHPRVHVWYIDKLLIGRSYL
jgi:hypothetical protein